MRERTSSRPARALAVTLLTGAALAAGCSDRDTSTLEPFQATTEPLVFDDDFTPGLDFQAFLGSRTDAVSIDASVAYEGSASLRVFVPLPTDPAGSFAGGAFTTSITRNLTQYDALTFYARASEPAIELNEAGLGNDNTGTSRFQAGIADVALDDAEWTKVIIPIPLPEKLVFEQGLFWFAEGAESDSATHEIWFDEVRFETLGTITNPRPFMTGGDVQTFAGTTLAIEGTGTVFDVDGTDVTVSHFPGYFTFSSSDESVARVLNDEIQVVGGGSAEITAMLGDVPVNGTITIGAIDPPSTSAPAPTEGPADVISLFSDAYVDITVDTWSADWDAADVADVAIGNDNVKAYSNLVFAGVEFVNDQVDASQMTHFHLDVWATAGTQLKVKLVDFGENGTYDPPGTGGDDSEHEVVLAPQTIPPFTTGEWVSLDIPMAAFATLAGTSHISQLVLSGAAEFPTLYVDNVYFHR